MKWLALCPYLHAYPQSLYRTVPAVEKAYLNKATYFDFDEVLTRLHDILLKLVPLHEIK
jgi:hypothetical protein